MNVASLELCKELSELSGWDDTTFFWKPSLEWGHTGGSYGRDPSGKFELCTGVVEDIEGNLKPMLSAYDLGYLLRKLKAIDDPDNGNPENIYVELTVIKGYSTATSVRGITRVDAEQPHQRRLPSCEADTPEDAACKLSIRLFEQGILNKESQS